MKIKHITSLFFALTIGFLAVVSTNAQGTIVPIVCDIRPCQPIPRPRPVPIPNILPIKSINVDVKINGQVATTHVEQVFRNDSPYTLEGTYFFPIPENASIVEFAIWENGKKLVGEVRSREEARRIYDEIVRRQRDPGLLEYAGKDLFQASIFPIPPNSDKKLELSYSQVLKAESGTVAYRYPLGTGNRAWVNNQPVPMMSGVDYNGNSKRPDKVGTVAGKIEIAAPQALRNIYSPSHNIDIKHTGENKATMTFESNGKDQDFQLFYGLSNNDFGMSLVTYREPGKDGYFLLLLSPKDKVLDSEIAAKDIVFVVDTSGSMADEGKMEKARAALLFGIKNLRDGDRFNVINFAGEEHLMENGLIAANSDGRKRGEEFVKKLTPTGGTNINDALRAALKQFDGSDRPKLLVFMTDGLPTVGETNVEKIIKNSQEVKVDGLRLFTFGVGYDVNTKLLDKIAEENSGTADYIEPKEDLEVKVGNFFTKVNSPVLTGLNLDFGSVKTDLVYPRKTPDIFRGTQLTMIGRYKNEADLKNITLKLTGKNGKESRTFNYDNLSFPMRAEDNNFLPRLWATRRVGWLMEQIRSNGETKEVRDEIVDLGTRYGIVTPYTSYLATDGSVGNNINSRQVTDLPMQARSTGSGGGFGIGRGQGSGRGNAPQPKPTPSTSNRTQISADAISSGEQAVKDSKERKVKQEAEKVTTDDDEVLKSGTVQKVGVKTFYLENGVWIDGEFKEDAKMTEIKLKFASNEFFDLITKEKDLAQFFSLGEQVVVIWKGKVYRIIK
ncbi:MAG TPA: VIT and VWA domain-containing protein [Pyrinomonadaceae bacterium]|nr:VIT and VWA domain-containing protein [Pyrinomonadaceae bacterium]